VLRDRRSEAPAVEPTRVTPKGPNSVFNLAG
jgi:Rrf2 family transcriptional regulator, iron-sulfur cluster assembly transcription factor